MKLFKRIYYPIMAALVVFMLVMGFVDASTGGVGRKRDNAFVDKVEEHVREIASSNHNSYSEGNQEDVREYIRGQLTRTGSPIRVYQNDTPDEDGMNLAEFVTDSNGPVPTLYVQKAVVSQKTMEAAGDFYTETAVDKQVHNVIVAVPGSVTKSAYKAGGADSDAFGGAVLLTAHYDAAPIGGASDAVAVGAMIENALEAASGSYENDLFFVFTDASLDGSYGALCFLHQLNGFYNGPERIEVAANFEASGNKGSLMLYQTGENNLKLLGKYAKIGGGTFASSFTEVLYSLTGGASDFDVFSGINALNFTNLGGKSDYGTANDTAANVSRSFMGQQSDMMYKFYDYFGSEDLSKVDANTDAVFFSYLDIMTVWYPTAVAFVMAGVIIGLIVALTLVNRKKKAFGWGKVLGGAFVQLLTVVATALVLFVAYYLIALLLAGFGVLTLNSLSSVVFTSPGLMIAAMLLTFAVAAAFYIILKRTFAVRGPDVVRGNVLLWALAAVVICFAKPEISYLFAIMAILSLTVMLVTACLRDKFKAKFGTDMERLFLYVWPVVLVLPLFIPLVMTVTALVPAVFLPVVMAAFVGLLGCIAPYFDYLKPVFDKAVKKLPARTVRYERVVTERVEDRAKKGKFTEVTGKKIVREKVAWKYLNRVGLSAVGIVAAVMILLFTSFGGSFSSAVMGTPAYADAIYDDSMLYVWEKDESSTTSTIEVHDQSAYKYIKYAVADLKWDGQKKAYTKTFNGPSTVLPETPSVTRTDAVISVKTVDSDYSQIRLTLKNASKVKEVTFNANDVGRKSETFEYTNQDEIVFVLPYGYGDFDLTLNDDAGEVQAVFEQHVYNANNLQYTGGDWEALYKTYDGVEDVMFAAKSGMVLRLTQTLS